MGDSAQKDGVKFRAASSAANENDIGASSTNKPSKRAKKDYGGVDFLVQAFDCDTQIPANAINEVVVASTTLSDGLFKIVNSLLGFQREHKFKYYTHLVATPDTARAFMNLQLLYKIKCMGYGLR
jgi:hypothetical protein